MSEGVDPPPRTEAENTWTLGFTGDVMLGRLVDERYGSPGGPEPSAIWGDVRDRLRELDARCINLECCLSTRGEPWDRTYRPFHFRADPGWAVPALEAAAVDVASLANNHVLDFGEPALRDTLEHLDAARIARVGAGETLDAALDPARVRVGDGSEPLRVAVLAFTDNTPEYAAEADGPGTAHVEFDVDDDTTRSRIETALERARRSSPAPDLVIASLHWGPNMEEQPPTSFQRFARWLVEHGVDVIHGHSAHVFQGIELVDRRPVMYDTGDFVDDYRIDPDLRNDRSFLFEVTVARRNGTVEPTRLRLLPTEIVDRAVRFADPSAASWARERMRNLSEPFGTAFERRDEALVCRLDDGAPG